VRLVLHAAGADASSPTSTTYTTTTTTNNDNGPPSPTKQATTRSNGTAAPRGALIAVEGLDRSGKSTQLTKLVEALRADGVSI
jgi:hypothetical protein